MATLLELLFANIDSLFSLSRCLFYYIRSARNKAKVFLCDKKLIILYLMYTVVLIRSNKIRNHSSTTSERRVCLKNVKYYGIQRKSCSFGVKRKWKLGKNFHRVIAISYLLIYSVPRSVLRYIHKACNTKNCGNNIWKIFQLEELKKVLTAAYSRVCIFM